MALEQMHVSLKLDRTRLEEGRDQRVYASLRLEAPRHVEAGRAPLDIVACIDVSGSMRGLKLARVKESLERLVGQLASDDRLALVAFDSEAAVCSAPVHVDAEGRLLLREAIGRLHVRGSTNLSDGVETSLRLLGGPGRESSSLRRVLVFTDGHANCGIRQSDRGGWRRLLDERLGGASVSWFGYGEDHDADFLSSLSDVSGGNYYFARDADAIVDAFAKELGALVSVSVRDLRVRLRPASGPLTVLNDEPVKQDGVLVEYSAPELVSEERRHVVFELPVTAGHTGERRRLVDVDVSWTDVRTGRPDSVTLSGHVSFVPSPEADKRAPEVLEQVVLVRVAAAQRRAFELAERHEFASAAETLLHAARFARSVPTTRAAAVARLLEEAARDYGDRMNYASSRSRWKSVEHAFRKQRSSGSVVDELFMTGTQRDMVRRFAQPSPDQDERDHGAPKKPESK